MTHNRYYKQVLPSRHDFHRYGEADPGGNNKDCAGDIDIEDVGVNDALQIDDKASP